MCERARPSSNPHQSPQSQAHRFQNIKSWSYRRGKWETSTDMILKHVLFACAPSGQKWGPLSRMWPEQKHIVLNEVFLTSSFLIYQLKTVTCWNDNLLQMSRTWFCVKEASRIDFLSTRPLNRTLNHGLTQKKWR